MERRVSKCSIDSTQEVSGFRTALPQFLAVGVKNVLLFGYGMTLGFPTIVIPAIQGGDGHYDEHPNDIKLNKEEISWFSSINLLCVPLGCIFSGMLTQPIGKRMAMQIVNIPILVAWLLFYFSTNVYHLYAGLCLAGLSGGLLEAPVLTYVAEVTQPKFRGLLAATGSTCLILGVFTQFLLGTFFDWRTIAAMSAIFPLLSITALFFVPESPHWLLLKDRTDDARKSLAWLRGWVPVERVEAEFREIQTVLKKLPSDTMSVASSTSKGNCVPYSKKSFLVPYGLVTLTFFIGHFSGKTPLQTYTVQIFHTLKAPIDKYYATVLLGAVEILGTVFCVVLIHYTGKRPLVLLSTISDKKTIDNATIEAHFTDHRAIVTRVPFSAERNDLTLCEKRTDYEAMKRKLSIQLPLITYDDANDYFNRFLDVFAAAYDDSTISVIRTVKYRHSLCPWMNAHLLDLIHDSNKAYDKSKAFKKKYGRNSPLLESKLRIIDKEVSFWQLHYKSRYYEEVFASSMDARKTWKNINNVLGRKKKAESGPIEELIIDGVVYRDDQQKADQLNSFFVDIGNKIAEKTSVSQNVFNKHPTLERVQNTIFFEPVTELEVRRLMSDLDVNKSPGLDGITASSVKQCADAISPAFTDILNLAIFTGVYPDRLKIARVSAIYKSESKNDPSNYRPISVLPILNKIFEIVIYNRLMKFLNKHDFLFERQYGFRKRSGTHTATYEILNQILLAKDGRRKCQSKIFYG